MLAWSAMSTGFFADPRRPSDLSDACAANPESVRRREILHSVAADHGQTAEAIHIRWLATAARHLFPVISSSRPDRISALMNAAGDSSLDPAVADLVARIAAEHPSQALRSLLLPQQMPRMVEPRPSSGNMQRRCQPENKSILSAYDLRTEYRTTAAGHGRAGAPIFVAACSR